MQKSIPYLYIDDSSSQIGKYILNKVKRIFISNNIGFVIYENKKYKLIKKDKIVMLKNIEEVLYICKSLIIIESSYNNLVEKIVDSFLEKGLDILCFPSNILNKSACFSNNLIRDGAICLTSEYMLIEYIK